MKSQAAGCTKMCVEGNERVHSGDDQQGCRRDGRTTTSVVMCCAQCARIYETQLNFSGNGSQVLDLDNIMFAKTTF